LATPTLAAALDSVATARASAARALSSSVAEGTLPPESLKTSSRRARLARDSATVALLCATSARAAASEARERVT
jgi:hypothetical protein